MTDNVTLKEDEILAITSIFGEDSFQKEEEEKKATDSVSSFSTYIFKLSLDDNNSITTNNNNVGSKKELKIRFYFSLDYPSDEPPIYEILSVYCGVMKIDDLIRLEIDQNFRKLFVPGEVVIFSWIEWLKDYLLNKLLEEEFSSININDDNSEGNEVNEKVEEELMTVEKNLNLENIKNINSETCPKIFHGEPLEHKKSIFLAHLAKVNNIQEVKLVRSMLLSDRKIAKATHNIMAYRILLDNGAILQETAAGSRLLHLLQMLDSRNVIVVVTRWYGGILLGPVRLPPNSMNINNSTFRQSEFSKDTTDMDIYEATAAGNLDKVKELLAPKDSGGIVTAFHRANIPNLSSGLTPLHYAASRGHLEIVEWLIEYAGAIVDLEDQTGENALLKASYNGHISVVKYLLEKEANVSQKDNDGWTALHNASAQGYLPIIKHLLEVAKADVDVGSNKNITPLMNASSRGHVGIVEYLLNRAGANPFIKNSFGETAFDSAATSNEAYICELLEKAERDWWKGKRAIPEPISFRDLENSLPPINQPYDVFAFHISVPIILHENQRASSIFPVSLRRPPKYSAANLLKTDYCSPWSLYPSGQPSSKEAVKLPVGPNSSTVSIVTNISSRSQNRLWFWVDEWHIDMTHPRIDAQGWQYARSFDEADKKWSIIPPANANTWVRRRRWVRVMKRRMNLSESNNPLRFINENNSQLDYIEKAETIIKLSQDYNKRESIDMSEQLIRYKEAIRILKTGIESETDNERKQEANSLIDSFTQHSEYLESIRKGNSDVYAKSPTSSFHDVPMTPTHIPNSSSNNIFKLELPITPSTASFKSFETIEDPWSMTTTNDDIAGNSSFSNYYGNGGVGNGQSMMTSPTRLNSQFSLNITSVPTTNSITSFGVWENDDDVHECRQCRRRFNLWIRRHHCRRCGQVVCDRCSLSRLILPPSQVIFDPSAPNDSSSSSSSASQYHRVCDSCHSSMGHPTKKKRSNSITSSTSIKCPVCNMTLSKVPGSKSDQEHIKNCLENQNGNSVSVYKYVGEQKIAF
ncbi:14942_t:CDS:10 [Entrophospora sp. SA101]|nr:14942_t:CDS:10 [Entrophospora sp. SA101]